MFVGTFNKLLDKAQSQDFWRGVLYLVAAAGVHVSPENAAQIVSGALAISGFIHMVWHKQHPELPE
jgi:hypothetical protein